MHRPSRCGHLCEDQREAGDEKADAAGAKCHMLFLRGQKRRVAPRLFIRGTVIGPRLQAHSPATLISFPLLPGFSPKHHHAPPSTPKAVKGRQGPPPKHGQGQCIRPLCPHPPAHIAAKHKSIGPILLLRLPTRPYLPNSRLRLHPCSRRFCRLVRPPLRSPLLARGVCQQRRRERFAPCRLAV